MSVEVTVEQSENEHFKIKPGVIVCLDSEQFPDEYPYVVLVTDTKNKSFSGVILKDGGDRSWSLGTFGERFMMDSFVKFTGKIIMESK